jgi:ADP-ribose pyrophosphatase YjhB (NUDIX family)/predicted transcriptional regulator
MIDNQPLHKAQLSILTALRHTNAARFSDLMQPTGLTSDTFKFHIRKLAHAGIIEKIATGEYRLTAHGKAIANITNQETRTIRRQPKLSVLLVVTRQGADGQTEYVVQRRLRNPFYGYWGFPSGPINWGEMPEQAAHTELKKQTGISADFTVSGFYREQDISDDPAKPLEDKLFTVLTSVVRDSDDFTHWIGGHNEWMTARQLQKQEHFFGSCLEVLAMLDHGQMYSAQTVKLADDEY